MPFVKGKSGNPGGQSKAKKDFREQCRKLTQDSLEALKRGLDDPENYIQAAKILLEFGHGKPTQALEHSGEVSGPAPFIINWKKQEG